MGTIDIHWIEGDRMNKLRLDLDALRVETFEAAGHEPQAAVARTPMCSAIDACPTRPCETGTR